MGKRTASISEALLNKAPEMPVTTDLTALPVHLRTSVAGSLPAVNPVAPLNNTRQRIAPASSALVSVIRSRDPRLMIRGGAPNSASSDGVPSLHPAQIVANTFNGVQSRMPNSFSNGGSRTRQAQQRFPPTMNAFNNNAIPGANDSLPKDTKDESSRREKTSRSSSSSKYSSKSGSSSSKSGTTSSSKSSSSHKSPPTSRSSGSSKSSGSRSTKSSKSSSSSTNKTKERSDDRSPRKCFTHV